MEEVTEVSCIWAIAFAVFGLRHKPETINKGARSFNTTRCRQILLVTTFQIEGEEALRRWLSLETLFELPRNSN